MADGIPRTTELIYVENLQNTMVGHKFAHYTNSHVDSHIDLKSELQQMKITNCSSYLSLGMVKLPIQIITIH